MKCRRMTRDDLDTVMGWTRTEQWNPGEEDAEAFWTADPEGFFVSEEDDTGRLVSCVSVVNHDDENAFLGIYICLPEYRGKGYGLAVWKYAIQHAEERSVTLEGLKVQQSNYKKSGFVNVVGETIRYAGHMEKTTNGVVTLSDDSRRGYVRRAVAATDMEDLLAGDLAISGFQRPQFAKFWFSPTTTRETVVLTPDESTDKIIAFATFRKSADGIRVGPLSATDSSQVLALLQGRTMGDGSETLFIDVPEESVEMTQFLQSNGFQHVFDTAKMVKGNPPKTKIPPFCAVTTLEVG